MIDAALSLITGTLWPYIAAALAAMAGLIVAYAKGHRDAKSAARTDNLKREVKAHEARKDAETAADAAADPRDGLRRDWHR